MLLYLGSGVRDYKTNPIRPMSRGRWEFQAFLQGSASLVSGEGRIEPATSRTVYVCGPECVHGWMGNGSLSEVAVFQFAEVPDEMKREVPRSGWIQRPLTARAVLVLRRLLSEARRESGQPNSLSSLRFQRILIELTLEILRPVDGPEAASSRDRKKVDQVIAWYMAQMSSNPTLLSAASAHAISTAHLRRLFHVILGKSPREVMEQMRFQKAMELIEFSDQSMGENASALGYSEPSAFSRAFKKRFGIPPSKWR